jgi:hypothetical protein
MTRGDNLVYNSPFRPSAPSSGRLFRTFGEVQPQPSAPNGPCQHAERAFEQPSSCSWMQGGLKPAWLM